MLNAIRFSKTATAAVAQLASVPVSAAFIWNMLSMMGSNPSTGFLLTFVIFSSLNKIVQT